MKVSTIRKSISAALAIGLVLAASGVAEAKGNSGSKGSSMGSKGSSMGSKGSKGSKIIVVNKGHDHHRHHGHRGYYGAGVYAASEGCGWLKVRAVETGSRYWWSRYEACTEG